MCFSAEASFIASAVLAIAGYASFKVASVSSYRWLASIPLLFAIQQFNEGILWLYLPNENSDSLIANTSQFIFMLFAYLFWPVWVPFAILMAEVDKVRRTIIGLSLIAGITMISYFIWNFFNSTDPVQVSIIGHSIHYSANDPLWRIIYIGIVLIPCFASSLRLMKVFGILVGISFIVAEYYYTAVFVSVWCFFAAIISLALFFVLRANRLRL